MLQNSDLNIKQLCAALNIQQSTCTINAQILENADLIETRFLPAKTQGSQKLCFLKFEKIMLPLTNKEKFQKANLIETEMPIGLFSNFKVNAPCGIVSGL